MPQYVVRYVQAARRPVSPPQAAELDLSAQDTATDLPATPEAAPDA